jgi:hypothetical protein
MLALLLGIAGLALGAGIGRWAVLWLPVGLGAVAFAAGAVTGALGWEDTPVPFLVLLTTSALAVGVLARQRRGRPA